MLASSPGVFLGGPKVAEKQTIIWENSYADMADDAMIQKMMTAYEDITGTAWALPSVARARALRSKLVRARWSRKSNMRCVEIVVGVFSDPLRFDPSVESRAEPFSCVHTWTHTLRWCP